MKRIGMNSVIWLFMLMLIPALAGAKSMEKVSAEGASSFYYKTDGESIAKNKAKDKLNQICKKKNMRLYEGKYNRKTRQYSLITYNHMECDEEVGGKKCSVQASGYCINTLQTSFRFSCGKNKPAVSGMLVAMPGNTYSLLTDSGTRLNLHASSVNDTTLQSLCETKNTDDKMVDKLMRYVRKSQNNIHSSCAALVKAQKRAIQKNKAPTPLPDGCKSEAGGIRN